MVAWKPQVDGALQELRGDLSTLRQQLGRVALNPILSVDPATLHPHLAASTTFEAGGVGVTHGDPGRGPGGHRGFQHHRGLSAGEVPLTTPPINGTLPNSDPYTDSGAFMHRGSSSSSGNFGPRPKINFPVFIGERPKSWKK